MSVPVRINFQNATADQVEIMWKDQNSGESQGYGYIDPNGAYKYMEITVGDEYSFKNTRTGEMVTVNGAYSFIVEAGHDGQTIGVGQMMQPAMAPNAVAPAAMNAGMQQMQQQTVTTTTQQTMMVPFGNTAQGGYDTGMNPQMFMVTTTVTTTTIVQSFGFSTVYQPKPVNPEALKQYQQYKNNSDGDYEGPYDENGQRCGVGRCKWPDGSTYEGDWLNNVRHGAGRFDCDDYTYCGEWQQDLKHGRGKYTRKPKERKKDDSDDEDEEIQPIYAPFENDKLNGLGTCGAKTVLYKDGMEVVLSGHEKDCGKMCKYICQFITNILCIAAIVVTPILQAPVAIFSLWSYIIYQIFSCLSTATKYLDNCMSCKDLFRDVAAAIKSPPTAHLKIQCYHYETRTNSKGKKRRVRVNTHSARQKFEFSEWVDKSPPASTIDYLAKLLLCRLNIDEIVQMSPTVRSRYKEEKREFVKENDKDTHYNFWFATDVPYTVEHTLVYQSEHGEKPWYAKSGNHCILNIFMLGWIQRYLLETQTFEVQYKIIKYLYGE